MSVICDSNGLVAHYRCCVIDRSLMIVSAVVDPSVLLRPGDRSGGARILRGSAWRLPWNLNLAIREEELWDADAASRIVLRA